MKMTFWLNSAAVALNATMTALSAGPHELQWFCIGMNGAFALIAAVFWLNERIA